MMKIIEGDCLDVMKTFPDNHFSAVVTDPPYGLHFMGKGWDYEVPGIEYWKECLRITKPGSYLLVMGGSRTSHRVASAIESCGYEIRDTIMWIYGSGFPKSHNHFGIEGYGTALKPAYEPIIMAMKPCDGTFKQNAEKWGQAGINVDGCRIPSEQWKSSGKLFGGDSLGRYGEGLNNSGRSASNIKGRWPANLILDEEAAKMLDEQSGNLGLSRGGSRGKSNMFGIGELKEPQGFGDRGGASRFFYVAKASSRERNEGLEHLPDKQSHSEYGLTENSTSSSGIQQRLPCKNNHPTVKPLKLMEYLIKLVMPPNDKETQNQTQKCKSLESPSQELDVSKKAFKRPILLDPFAGSGTTILAAKRLGFDAIGIEKHPEYAEIARARCNLNNAKEIPQLEFAFANEG